ncbi:MAG TPA: prolyl oligopeptidase family serine peptidase [Candidatus Saccharimonadales bacterium]|nr:prolyl oligopeptidase family serine peptidase [Candidatus Saccharimonadales bacterium]
MAIFKKRIFGKHNKKVVFLFSGWRMNLSLLLLPIKILERNGFYCICYTYDNDVFSTNIPQTVHNIQSIKNDVLEAISQLKTNGYTNFSVISVSLGGVIAMLVGNESKDVKKIIFNTGGADIALNVWTSSITRGKFKQEIIDQGYTLESLREAWRSINPLDNIENLRDKKILIYLAQKDNAIPFLNGMMVVGAFQKKKYSYSLIVNTKFGHLLTGIYNSLNAKVYLDFLNS